jgi:hypothetical protein
MISMQLSHDSVKKVNPKLEVQFNILRHLAPPMVEFKFGMDAPRHPSTHYPDTTLRLPNA